ncbi:terminase large subunit [Metabacillus litoralis]|uniref:terminase large subunit n=1 Tax=Metabacillus litoralis TaxID=152268 RepID=UPI0020406C6C|nr:terminase large subunit [Metabacillus litoralis]
MDTLIERIFDYAYDIVDGKINSGKKHKQACERFLNDIEKIKEDDFPFYFDAEELETFYEWAKMFKHTKGVLAGKPIELTDFQLFLAANLFCWKRKSDNTRRFRKAYIQLARKNAKTQFLALITSYVSFLSEEQEECYIAGWNRDQSAICYNEVLSQIKACEILKGKYSDSYGKITHNKSGSVIQPLSREARKTGDGKNPSIAVIDEYHAHETSEIYDVMVSGMVARKNPLIVIITTAGFDLSKPCFTEYQYVSRILDPENETDNDAYFIMICELDPEDDVKDESNWIKANPIVATYQKGIESIRDELKIALDVPEKMRSFLTKNMDKWVDQKENGYIDMSKWRKCKGDMVPLAETSFYLGLDMSLTTDLTSYGWVGVKEGNFYIGQHSFMPEERLKEKMAIDKVRYDLWEEQGYLTLTPGETIDYKFVEEWMLSFIRRNRIQVKEVAYDKWKAEHIAQDLQSEGFITVEIPQRIAMLTLPTTGFREKVYEGKVIHDGDPLLEWAVSNAVIKMDDQENMMISKKVSKNRIDPIASIINAYARAMYDNHSVDLNSHFLSGWSL